MPLRLPARPLLYRRTLILLVHIALIPLAYLAAFGLRFDFQIPPQEFAHFQTTVWYLLGIRLIVFWAGGLYRGYWKHVGLRDLVDLGLAVTISSAAFVAALSPLGPLRGIPRSVVLLDWVVMIFFSGRIPLAARGPRENRPARSRLDGQRATIDQLRDLAIEDLLGRDPVHLNLEQIKQDLAGKSILVTGGAGSIGSELARQIASYGPARLVLLERAESALYFTHLEVAKANPGVEVVPFIGSITNPDRLEEMFRLYQPNYVFHAAAYKHVPMLESNATEAVWNNVFGTLRVAECAALHGVEKFVLISTDKAVNPTSVLGATKRIGERIVLELPSLCEAATDFRAVRFGNVLGSDGSVVPLFKRQISAGGPGKVTHPDVTRYFMTISESVALVLQAAALPEAARRISILEMGKPIRILELAEQLIRLSGLEPYRDISIAFSGLRPGEKLAEELVACAEDTVATSDDKIRVIERNGADGPAVERDLEHLLETLANGSRDELIDAISRLVPEYVPWQTRERPHLAPAHARATPDSRSPLRPAYARTAGAGGAPTSATARTAEARPCRSPPLPPAVPSSCPSRPRSSGKKRSGRSSTRCARTGSRPARRPNASKRSSRHRSTRPAHWRSIRAPPACTPRSPHSAWARATRSSPRRLPSPLR